MKNKINISVRIRNCLRPLFAVITIIITLPITGQVISHDVVASSGETFINQGITLFSSVGELSVESYQDQNILLTQGFLQYDEGSTSVSELQQKLDEFILYPNPACESLNLSFSVDLELEKLIIYDIHGSKILSNNGPTNETHINIGFLAPGLYLIKLHFKDAAFVTKQFIKH